MKEPVSLAKGSRPQAGSLRQEEDFLRRRTGSGRGVVTGAATRMRGIETRVGSSASRGTIFMSSRTGMRVGS